MLFCFSNVLQAQFKTRLIHPVSDTIILDTIPIALASIQVSSGNYVLKFPSDFTLDHEFKKLIIKAPEKWDSLSIKFQTYPQWLISEQKHRSPEIYHYATSEIAGSEKPGTPGSDDDILTDGILLRGISFGNAQDLVLNSSLNLRMHGKVSKDIEIEGAVTDQEFPFQPEGTTSTLQDFDRIYVALHMPHISVLLGDYAYQSPANARFLKYSKKNRGLQLKGKDSLGRSAILWEATAALARGRFSRNEISGVEGLQGPYKLNGARGEQFVIVVSGTEQVYLDGKKMERGLQADYVIDYNTGEVTFTPKHIITAFSRIVVEFQYSDRFYTRSVTGGNVTMIREKTEYYAGIYSEQDARNQPIQQDLEAFDSSSGMSVRDILKNSGDDPALSQMSGVRRLTAFSTSEPNYILRDTGGVVFYEYVALPDTHQVFYRLTFTYTGPGKGTYLLTGSSANGKVYRYAGTVSGVPAGDYEPVMLIQPPNRLSVAETGLRLKPRKGTIMNANVSATNNDKNLFSPLNDDNNSGVAAFVSISDRREFKGRDSVKKWYVQNGVQAEQTSAYFTSVERYRDVEFGRGWNRSLFNPDNGMDIKGSGYVNGSAELGFSDRFAVFLNGGMNRSNALAAKQLRSGMRLRFKDLYAFPLMEWSRAEVAGLVNEFRKQEIKTGYEKSNNRIELAARKENSLYSNALAENLPQNYGFRELALTADHNADKLQWNLLASQRVNRNLKLFDMVDAVRVSNAGTEVMILSKKKRYFKLGMNYRNMMLMDTFFKKLYSNEDHIAARLEYNFSKILRVFDGNIFYQSISGREQQRQYSYFEVPAGQGFYTWVDFNSNGVKEVNEFQETPFKDQARYVRLLVPTGNYIKAQGTEFNGNLWYRTAEKKDDKKHGKFQNKLTWNYNGRSAADIWYRRIAPFTDRPSDTDILAFQGFLRNLAEYEGKSGKWMVQYNVQFRGSKIYFTNGFDMRNSGSHQVFFRADPGKSWQVRLGLENKKSRYLSEFVPSNNFEYVLKGAEPVITFQPGSRFRISTFGKLGAYDAVGVAVARLYEGGVQWNLSLKKGSMFELRSSYLKADYFLTKGTALSYDVLQGFSPGNNFRGVADLRFSAGKNVQIIMSYESRKTGDAKLIHVGRAEARYLF